MPLNPIAALLMAGLLFLAVGQQRDDQLLALLKEEKPFIKWLFAIAIILWLYRSVPAEYKGTFGGLIGLAFVGMALESKDAFVQLDQLFRGITQ